MKKIEKKAIRECLEKFSKDVGISEEQLMYIFNFGEDDLGLITVIKGKKESEKQIKATLCILTAYHYCYDSDEIRSQDLRKKLEWLGITSLVHLSLNLTKYKQFIISRGVPKSPNFSYKITYPGIKKGLEIIKELSDAQNKLVKPGKDHLIPRRKEEVKETEKFLAFNKSYPQIFYNDLENEINLCYINNLLNACLVLSRKMVENLVYEILYLKFPKDIDLRYNTSKGRPHDFFILIDSLNTKRSEFNQEQQRLIQRMISLIGTFRTSANSKAHDIIEYVNDKEELDTLKIPEIIQLAISVINRLNV